ncbi:MAG: hypothetical protein M3394_07310 [Actinomycetota bacterium]|nr:hypothetical protein [Actinomycetota bacterium]
MNRRGRALHEADELIQVVLDDASVERLRCAAAGRGIDVEQLMVQLLHIASLRVDDILPTSGPESSDPVPVQT